MKFLEEFRTAILIRSVEEKLLDLFKKGKLNGTVHTCIGQEFTGVAIAKFLEAGDFVFSNHRGHGHYVARTKDLNGLFAELMGRTAGCSGGIGGSQHLYNNNYLSNGIQGGMTPIATGVGLGNKIVANGNVAVVFVGDGTFGEGVLYEAFNIAGIWEVPVVYVLENNSIAQSTSFSQSFSGSVQKRVEGFGIKYFKTFTNNLDDLFSISQKAIAYARDSCKPAFIEVMTNRLFSHSKGDDNRDPEDVHKLSLLDNINALVKSNFELYTEIKKEVDLLIEKAVEVADNAPLLERVITDFHFSFPLLKYATVIEKGGRNNEEIYEFFKLKMNEDASVIMIGEDIETANEYNNGEYGGAFRVSRDLSKLYPGRIRNTPISEAGIVGVGTGLSLMGYRPVIEIMFGDFLTLTLDQLLQHAAKFRLMYNNQVNVPIIVRTPMGGHRGYGPTHSQSIEKFFLGIPDLFVAVLNHRISPKVIYESVFLQTKVPFLVIENKIVYTIPINSTPINGFLIEATEDKFPTVRIRPDGLTPDITILGYGGILIEIEKAIVKLFDEEEILCEVISPTLIHPFDLAPIAESVCVTKKILIVEEGASFAAFGSEVISRLAEESVMLQKVARLSNNSIIPCSFEAEKNTLPTEYSIFEKVKSMLV